ncbi:hypothetical protein [Streptomyces sp. NPDC058735]|uniref:hypothetical protein n=1 Tax=unclassified Streptomyces TaxID=2593676 RepID=UPI00369E5DB4
MSVLVFLLSLGTVCRVTRFLTKDALAAGLRSRIADRFGDDSRLAYLITCGWCVSIWVAGAVTALAYWAGEETWFQAGATLLTLSYLTGLAATWVD